MVSPVDLSYEVTGEGPPLYMVHGIGSRKLTWGGLVPELSKHYYCVAMDTIGDLGRSYPKDGDPKNGPKNEAEMAEWAHAVTECYCIVSRDRQCNTQTFLLMNLI